MTYVQAATPYGYIVVSRDFVKNLLKIYQKFTKNLLKVY